VSHVPHTPRRGAGVEQRPVALFLRAAALSRAVNTTLANAAFGLCALLAACSASRREAPALRTPDLRASVAQRCGEPLGVTAPPGAAHQLAQSNAPSWTATIQLRATEFAPSQLEWRAAHTPLSAHASLISAELGGAPVEPRVQLADGAWRVDSARGAQWLAEGGLGRTREVDRFEGALLEGTTLRAQWSESSGAAVAPRALRVELGRPADAAGAARVALVFDGEVDFDHDSDPASAPVRTARREALRLDFALLPEGEPLRLLLPSPFVGGEARGLFLELLLDLRESSEARALALERCAASERGASEQQRSLAVHEARRAELEPNVEALEDPARARAALLQLALRTGAELAAELALSCSDSDLATLGPSARAALTSSLDAQLELDALGWRLERATLRALAAQKEARALPYELEGVLLRLTGELGRSAAALDDVAQTCASLAEYHARLAAENRIFLDDASAAARVRAYDWLASRGQAPAGYDPLSPAPLRRAALEASEKAP